MLLCEMAEFWIVLQIPLLDRENQLLLLDAISLEPEPVIHLRTLNKLHLKLWSRIRLFVGRSILHLFHELFELKFIQDPIGLEELTSVERF